MKTLSTLITLIWIIQSVLMQPLALAEEDRRVGDIVISEEATEAVRKETLRKTEQMQARLASSLRERDSEAHYYRLSGEEIDLETIEAEKLTGFRIITDQGFGVQIQDRSRDTLIRKLVALYDGRDEDPESVFTKERQLGRGRRLEIDLLAGHGVAAGRKISCSLKRLLREALQERDRRDRRAARSANPIIQVGQVLKSFLETPVRAEESTMHERLEEELTMLAMCIGFSIISCIFLFQGGRFIFKEKAYQSALILIVGAAAIGFMAYTEFMESRHYIIHGTRPYTQKMQAKREREQKAQEQEHLQRLERIAQEDAQERKRIAERDKQRMADIRKRKKEWDKVIEDLLEHLVRR